jgi:hypothetical protein
MEERESTLEEGRISGSPRVDLGTRQIVAEPVQETRKEYG